jgi:hypothetical protein
MFYAIVGLSLLIAIASLAVDYGRVQLAKAQRRVAADAAEARYACTGITDNTWCAKAIDAANDNTRSSTSPRPMSPRATSTQRPRPLRPTARRSTRSG